VASPEFKARLRDAFNKIDVGHTYIYRRTFADSDVTAFCRVTGDFNPFHLDDKFAAESWFGKRILPGLLTASMATHIVGMIGFLASHMEFEFIEPVFVGDTLTCACTIADKDPEHHRLHITLLWTNQRGEEVLRGRCSGIPAQVRKSK
jgi:acyl dehydratase